MAVLFLLCFLLCFCTLFSVAARSRITKGELIRDGDTLVSDGLNFEMGFFNCGNSPSRYVGIWYYDVPQPTVIWVANREKPIRGGRGAITIERDGNLVIFDGDQRKVWSSNVSISGNKSSEAVLRDDGNLVLSVEGAKKAAWQSFENPTDAYLPGMKVPVSASKGKKNYVFTSWKSATDPSPGNYTMGVDPDSLPQIVIWEGGKRRWRSGYWDGRIFTGVYMTGSLLYGFTLNKDGDGGSSFTYSSSPSNGTDKVRFQMMWDGYEREFKWGEAEKQWIEAQKGPSNECEVYNKCGSFAACDLSSSGLPECSCIRGFEPKHKDQWDNGNWSGGCERVTPLKAETSASSEVNVGEDGFLERNCMRLPDFAHLVNLVGTEDCESSCLKNSSCTAYANVTGIGCMVWDGELLDLQHFENVGETLWIRLAASDLGKVKSTLIVVSIDQFFNFGLNLSVLFFQCKVLEKLLRLVLLQYKTNVLC